MLINLAYYLKRGPRKSVLLMITAKVMKHRSWRKRIELEYCEDRRSMCIMPAHGAHIRYSNSCLAASWAIRSELWFGSALHRIRIDPLRFGSDHCDPPQSESVFFAEFYGLANWFNRCTKNNFEVNVKHWIFC